LLRKARRSLTDQLYAIPPTVESHPTRALAGKTEDEEEKEEEEAGSAVVFAPTYYYYHWLSCWSSSP
jgi:hypothetical protein